MPKSSFPPALLNEALELSLAFGSDWRKSIEPRLASAHPTLTPEEREALNAVATEARDWSHNVIARLGKPTPATEARTRSQIRARYSWIDEKVFRHLWSQGLYYAMK